MDLQKLMAELEAERRILNAEFREAERWAWRGSQIHAGLLEPPQGAPPATGGAAQVPRIVDRRGPIKKPSHID
jgi:hypothetical protein